MGLKDLTLAQDATIAVTDGTPVEFQDDGITIANGVHLVCTTDVAYTTRRQITAKVRQPSVDVKTGLYSKDKKSLSMAFPMLLTGNKPVFNTFRIERELHPECSPEEAATINNLAAQLIVDANMANFWGVGSLS